MPITIELDRGSGPYKGGDLIVGKVVVINDSDKVRRLSSGKTIDHTSLKLAGYEIFHSRQKCLSHIIIINK